MHMFSPTSFSLISGLSFHANLVDTILRNWDLYGLNSSLELWPLALIWGGCDFIGVLLYTNTSGEGMKAFLVSVTQIANVAWGPTPACTHPLLYMTSFGILFYCKSLFLSVCYSICPYSWFLWHLNMQNMVFLMRQFRLHSQRSQGFHLMGTPLILECFPA